MLVEYFALGETKWNRKFLGWLGLIMSRDICQWSSNTYLGNVNLETLGMVTRNDVQKVQPHCQSVRCPPFPVRNAPFVDGDVVLVEDRWDKTERKVSRVG